MYISLTRRRGHARVYIVSTWKKAGTSAARAPGAGVGGPCGRDTRKPPEWRAPRQQFCFKNCTWTRLFVKLFMGPRPLSLLPIPKAVVFSPPHGGGGFSLNLLTAERVCASFRGAAGGVPSSGHRPLARTPGQSSPSHPEVASGVRASGEDRASPGLSQGIRLSRTFL